MAKAFGCSESGTRNALRQHKITRKKTTGYQEQDRQKAAAYQEASKDIPPEKIAYMDESGIDTYLYREYGYVSQGQQAFGVLVFQPASAFFGTRNRDCVG
ncbi:MAG: hypothetical protein HFF85_09030 [Oscillibacter sp.]|nr:hypothetical protein [Oscillibacter sp.]